MSQRKLSFLVLAGVLLNLNSCASIGRYAELRIKAHHHVYHLPLSELWPKVIAAFEEDSFSLRKPFDPNSLVLESDWNFMYYREYRYIVKATPVTGGYQLHAYSEVTKVETSAETIITPDDRMELKILRRIDPSAL